MARFFIGWGSAQVQLTMSTNSHLTQIEEIKNVVQTVQSVSTTLAIVIGGVWSYKKFVRKREKYPRAKIEHQVFFREILNEKALLRVDISVENVGEILLTFVPKVVFVRRISPVQEYWFNFDPNNTKWELIASERGKISQRKEIEPGESEQLIYDFIVPSNLEVISIHSYFENLSKSRRRDSPENRKWLNEDPASSSHEALSGNKTTQVMSVLPIGKMKQHFYNRRMLKKTSDILKHKMPVGWGLDTIHELASKN